ncbi:hypothetical protein EV426DRAFT_706332 [Tirmania nivea]|nr:hypothetical protein EV426DRAFT_706332 [Tirmania nivea]
MLRLGNSNGGMSPKALRSLYTGAVRAVFVWGAQLYNRPGVEGRLEAMSRLEYKALRKITGGYHGSSKEKLALIANIEPLKDKLDDMSRTWAARAVQTGDKQIRKVLESKPAPGCQSWNDRTSPSNQRDSPIAEAFYLTPADTPAELSFGNRDDTRVFSVIDEAVMDPRSERSRYKACWAAKIGGILDGGCRIVASGIYTMDRRGDEEKTYGGFLGDCASVADGELLAVQRALQKEDRSMVAILSDSQAAIQTISSMSRGAPPRSSIEQEIKEILVQASETRDVKVVWVRGHIGIDGNERADKRAAFESRLGLIRGTERTVTEGGIRAASKAIRKEARTRTGYGKRRCEWDRRALSAYTWMRTDRGPHKSWLHRIGKAADTECRGCGLK